MAYTTVNKSTDYFNTKLYTGNSGTQAITGVGHQPDLVWIKNRNDSNNQSHVLYDSVRGVTKYLQSNSSAAEGTEAAGVTAFGTDGFTVGNTVTVNTGFNYASWNWKAGTTSGLSGGTITPSAYSINTTSKFGIYKYTGNATGSQTIAHGLGATPSCVIFKELSGSEQWRVHFIDGPNPYTHAMLLNSDSAQISQSNGLSAVSSTTITFGSDGAYNASGDEYICYVFCNVNGYSKSGSYLGNGNTDGAFIYTGFKPAFILIKDTGTTEYWHLFDNKRLGLNAIGGNAKLHPNVTNTETTTINIDILSNGFKHRSSDSNCNGSGDEFVYMAFGQSLVGSNNVPCTAR